jgi:hypothetical protein
MQKLDHKLVYEKNANFFAETWQKSQNIVIITSPPGDKPGNELLNHRVLVGILCRW